MKTRGVRTPLGVMRLTESEGKLCSAVFVPEEAVEETADSPLLDEAEKQLKAYFEGKLERFHLPISIGGTPFEQSVLRALLEIPYGQTRSYGQIAQRIGKTTAARAVGGACARNPLHILVPCHRVIAGSGKLTGYAAGLHRKLALLQMESRSKQNQ